jgi:hypothetical protein
MGANHIVSNTPYQNTAMAVSSEMARPFTMPTPRAMVVPHEEWAMEHWYTHLLALALGACLIGLSAGTLLVG